VPVLPKPALQCTATPLFSYWVIMSTNFLITLSLGQEPSGNSRSKTLIPCLSKMRASYKLSFSLMIAWMPIYLKIGRIDSGVCDGYYRDTVLDGDAHAKIRYGITHEHSKFASSTKRSFETHRCCIAISRPRTQSAIVMG
jgi:hypothetical protein